MADLQIWASYQNVVEDRLDELRLMSYEVKYRLFKVMFDFV